MVVQFFGWHFTSESIGAIKRIVDRRFLYPKMLQKLCSVNGPEIRQKVANLYNKHT